MNNMTREDASLLLDVGLNATPEEINAAYRKAARKYHPDAWRTKSKPEQQMAEDIYSKLPLARKTLLAPPDESLNTNPYAPPKAARDVQTPVNTSRSYSSYRPTRTPARPSQTMKSTARSTAESIDWDDLQSRYMKSSSFASDFGSVPDAQEEQLAQEYAQAANVRYANKRDIIRITASIFGSIIALCALTCCIMGFNFVDIEFFRSTMESAVTAQSGIYDITSMLSSEESTKWIYLCPLIAFAVIALKIVIYDLIISYSVHKSIEKKQKINGLLWTGISGTLCSMVVLFTLWGYYNVSMAFIATAASLILLAAGIALSIFTRKKNEDHKIT